MRRLGKRIAIGFEGDHWLVLHLMIAGRLHWFRRRRTPRQAARRWPTSIFDRGTLTLTEAGTKRRASLYVVWRAARSSPRTIPGGWRFWSASFEEFRARLLAENHTLKRSLTDPRTFSGIGNAYSDEILHRARLSPVALTQKLDERQIARLYEATRAVLTEWTDRLREAAGEDFPEKVTAFRPRNGGARALRQALPGLRQRRCSASAMPTTKPTIARAARPRAAYSRTARYRGC